MIRWLGAIASLASLAMAPAAGAQTCLTTPQAESIALVVMPDILRQTGIVCAARLPATSPLRRSPSPLIERYDREAERAWPAAKAAIVKLSVPEAELLLGSDFARPVVATLVAPLVVGRIAPTDCAMIDRLVTLLDPLPPRNTAGVLVTMLQYLQSEKAKGRNVTLPDLRLCEVAR